MENNVGINKTQKTDLFKIDPRAIVENEYNVRVDFGDIESLAQSIKENGVLNPITVQERGNEQYVLVDGARRLRAVKYLIENGVDIYRIPAIKMPKSLSAKDLYLQHVVRNGGKALTDYEYGVAIYNLQERFGMTLTEISAKICVSLDLVSRYRNNLDRSEKEIELLKEGRISTQMLTRLDQEFGDDLASKLKAIDQLDNIRKDKGEKKLSLKNLDMVKTDSKKIKEGMAILQKYVLKCQETNGRVPKFTAKDIVNGLKAQGKEPNIVKLLEDLLKTQTNQAQTA